MKLQVPLILAAALALAFPGFASAQAAPAEDATTTATRADSKTDQDAAFKQLVENADEIAAFLGGANPHLPVDTLRSLLTAHGSHHVQQIQQFSAGQFDEEAKTWAMMKDHMYVIADALAGGIAKQFPDKFR